MHSFKYFAATLAVVLGFSLNCLAGTSDGNGITTADPTFDLRARASAEVSKKLFKGFKVSLSEEIRFKDSFSSFDKSKTGISLNYKPIPWLRMGAGYTFIYDRQSISSSAAGESLWEARHRWYAEVTGMFSTGGWTFSLRERFQQTISSEDDVNIYQDPLAKNILRTRVKAEYQCFAKPLKPYGYLEMRNRLNGVRYSGLSYGSSGYVYEGGSLSSPSYTDLYISRMSLCGGVEWRLDKSNLLDGYVIADYRYNRDYDVNKKGTKIKSIVCRPSFVVSIGIAYRFSW